MKPQILLVPEIQITTPSSTSALSVVDRREGYDVYWHVRNAVVRFVFANVRVTVILESENLIP